MTLRELSQLYYLKREIALDRERLAELENRALPGAQVMTGLPVSPNVGDKLANYAAEIADLRAMIEEKCCRCLAEQQRLEQYITGIDNSFIRQIFTLRFMEGLTWQRVANRMGGKNSADSVRKISKRFLDKN